MHIGSGVDYAHLSSVCNAMVDVVASIDHDIEAISAGGGLSIPYREGDPRIDCDHYFEQWDAARKRIAQRLGHDIRLEIEPGRFLVAEAGAWWPRCIRSTAAPSATSRWSTRASTT